MQLTFNTSEGRKELPVKLVGTLAVCIPLWKMNTIHDHLLWMNDGKIGYDTFCHRVNRQCELVMPAANDSATVLVHHVGYDEPDIDNRGSRLTKVNVVFLVYEPVYGIERDVVTRLDAVAADELEALQSPFARIRIETDDNKIHHYKVWTDADNLGWLVTAMEALAVEQCECIVDIKIGLNKGGLAHEWIRGSRRILYRNIKTGDETLIEFPWNRNTEGERESIKARRDKKESAQE